MSPLPKSERTRVCQETRFVGTQRARERSQFFEAQSVIARVAPCILFIELHEHAATLAEPSEQN
jgi:hypothetical protein